MKKPFALGFTDKSLGHEVERLIATYGFIIDNSTLPRLHCTARGLELLTAAFNPLTIDFNDAKWATRSHAGKQQGLVKACQPKPHCRIIDATAGWGRDAVILAHLGAEVLMLERNPVMAALLEDALHRFQPPLHFGALSLQHINAFDYLQTLPKEAYPDVIYIDPMHPIRQKKALVKKDMQALQQLVAPDIDTPALIKLAQQRTKHRVVVKWPQHLPPVTATSNCIAGKTVRFDIYAYTALLD